MRCAVMSLVVSSLAACSEPEVNSGDQVVVRVVNSTGLANVVVRVSDAGSSSETTLSAPGGASSLTLVTGIETAGAPARFEVTAGGETADHTCHVHADAIGNPDNLPTAVIYGDPLRVVCQSGWQETEH
jgi:hypothetical protein